jgi:hypothetical protein
MINIPTISLEGAGPLRDGETLEQGSGCSEVLDISDSFKKGFGMEILSINMELNVRFLVELMKIEVLNSDTYILKFVLKFSSSLK